MNLRVFLLSALCLSIGVGAQAQSAAEIAMAKSMARSYGYSDSEINAIMSHNVGGQAANASATTVSSPTSATGVEEVVVATPAAAQPLAFESAGTVVEPAAPATDNTGIYGHSYFASEGLGLIPSYNAPAPDSYVLGPGDEVIVDIWGSTVSHVVATIGNDGSINMSDLGPVYLAGMPLRKAEASLKAQLSRIYSGLSDDKGDTFLSLSIGKIKGVVVNVSGEVKVPGAYTIPSLCAIPSVIYMAGGLTDRGSVRNIYVFRQGRKVATFDLYDFIFRGASAQDIRLQEGDVINVPAYTNVVSINGAVARGQRYEMKDKETIQDLIDYALGFTTQARRDEVNLTRFESSDGVSFDVKSAQFGSFKLKDGDAVNVRSYSNMYSNRVSISGPVLYPGTYAIDANVTDVASLIRAAGGLVQGAYTERGQIERIDENHQPVFVTFNLQSVLDGKESVALMREDKVTLYSQDTFLQEQTVTISGHVKNPGTFQFHKGMTVADVILMADGVLEDVYGNRGQISRIDKDGLTILVPFNVSDALAGRQNVELMRMDNVRIYGIRELIQDADLSVNGEVGNPGKFKYYEGATLADAILLAGGYTNGADMRNIEIASRGGRERGSVVVYNLEENPALAETPLKPYDVVSVRRLTYFKDQVAVTVRGEVISPGTYVVDKTEVRLSDVINRAGGFTTEAYPHGTSLTRYLTKEEIDRQDLALKIASNSLGEGVGIDSTFTLATSFMIGIDLDAALKNPGSEQDVVLRAGDVINVPEYNSTVKVSGGVFYPNTLSYVKGQGWRAYIRQAGGFTKLARSGKTYAVYMNGKVAKGADIKPEPGMELVVPERDPEAERKVSAAEIAAIASSTSSVATMAIAISNIVKN